MTVWSTRMTTGAELFNSAYPCAHIQWMTVSYHWATALAASDTRTVVRTCSLRRQCQIQPEVWRSLQVSWIGQNIWSGYKSVCIHAYVSSNLCVRTCRQLARYNEACMHMHVSMCITIVHVTDIRLCSNICSPNRSCKCNFRCGQWRAPLLNIRCRIGSRQLSTKFKRNVFASKF